MDPKSGANDPSLPVIHCGDQPAQYLAFGGPSVAFWARLVLNCVLVVQFSEPVELLINGLPATLKGLAAAYGNLYRLIGWTLPKRMPKATT